MLDESIYAEDDIERAGSIDGCGFVKLKISKLTGTGRLARGLHRLRELGITPVVGNGAASDVGCLVEACVARSTVDCAGENNGFQEKPRAASRAAPSLRSRRDRPGAGIFHRARPGRRGAVRT